MENQAKLKKKVMIVDDDTAILDALRMILEDAGYEVKTEGDGRILLALKAPLPDLVLLDIWMSGMNGGDICKELKSNTKTKHIPVVLISANKDTEKIAIESGADGFIAKPFDMYELLNKVAQYV